VPEQLHEGVDADLGVGELGGERVPQAVDQRPGGRSPLRPVLVNSRRMRDCRVPRLIRSPSTPTNRAAAGGQDPSRPVLAPRC
jgi:hypothetical protein